MNHFKTYALVLCLFATGLVYADDAIVAKYLANAGVLISHGETKIVFDPLFDNDYDFYELVPEDIEKALFAGAPPFDGLDAVFVSHHHGDHFSPERMVQLLQAHPHLQLFGPSQAKYWAERHMHLAMPPYWYFTSDGGKKILEDHVRADETIGVHVPANIPDNPSQYPEELRGRTLFSVPGEEKQIPIDLHE